MHCRQMRRLPASSHPAGYFKGALRVQFSLKRQRLDWRSVRRTRRRCRRQSPIATTRSIAAAAQRSPFRYKMRFCSPSIGIQLASRFRRPVCAWPVCASAMLASRANSAKSSSATASQCFVFVRLFCFVTRAGGCKIQLQRGERRRHVHGRQHLHLQQVRVCL